MSLQVQAIARHATNLADLAQQMMELAELRRALCLQMKERSRPPAGRPLRRSAGSLRRPSCFRYSASAEPE